MPVTGSSPSALSQFQVSLDKSSSKPVTVSEKRGQLAGNFAQISPFAPKGTTKSVLGQLDLEEVVPFSEHGGSQIEVGTSYREEESCCTRCVCAPIRIIKWVLEACANCLDRISSSEGESRRTKQKSQGKYTKITHFEL